MDTIRRLAEQRHFHTVELDLAQYGRVMLVGDDAAVERVRDLVLQSGEHDLIDVTDESNKLDE